MCLDSQTETIELISTALVHVMLRITIGNFIMSSLIKRKIGFQGIMCLATSPFNGVELPYFTISYFKREANRRLLTHTTAKSNFKTMRNPQLPPQAIKESLLGASILLINLCKESAGSSKPTDDVRRKPAVRFSNTNAFSRLHMRSSLGVHEIVFSL